MGKGLGIAALVFAVLAIIVPIYGIYLGIVTSLLGIAVAALKEQALAVAIGSTNILNAVFFTPSLRMASAGAELAGQSSAEIHSIFWLWVGAALVSIVVAIVARRKKPKEVEPR